MVYVWALRKSGRWPDREPIAIGLECAKRPGGGLTCPGYQATRKRAAAQNGPFAAAEEADLFDCSPWPWWIFVAVGVLLGYGMSALFVIITIIWIGWPRKRERELERELDALRREVGDA